ncbi:hypothetical protein [Aliikangiella sp. IMCC44359]|uniref:hypothetical protein n=1 Tax=Aliikangiella sp. IMCC44359 TaxID=3459125 RepID=UPI00403AABDF
MNIYFIIAIALTVFFAYWFYRVVRQISTNAKLKKSLLRAQPLSKQSSVGDYVSFTGKLSTPKLNDPISQKTCGYWAIWVRGVFTRKKKKPNKGMQTHRSLILNLSSEEAPFMVANGRISAQMGFKKNFKLIFNPLIKTIKSRQKPLLKGIENVDPSIWKSKYQSYQSDILTLPSESFLTLWGKVQVKNSHSFILTSSENKKEPPLIFCGMKKQMFSLLGSQALWLTFFLLWILGCIALIWLWVVNNADAHLKLIAIVISVVGTFFLNRKIKNVFKKKSL